MTRRCGNGPSTSPRARALLDEAGWRVPSPPGDGIRRNAAGERLTIELMTTAGNRSREAVQQVIQGMWRQAGIEARIRNEPPRVLFGETLSRRRFTGAAMYAWISAPENVPRTTLHSDEIPRAERNWSGQNFAGFRNAEMDALLEAIPIELDRGKRRLLWQRLQAIYAEQLPCDPAVVPRRRACLAELARQRAPDRPPGADLALGGGVARPLMLDHVSIAVTDIPRAARFYDAVMAALGVPCVWREERAIGYGLRNSAQDDGHSYLTLRLGARAGRSGLPLVLPRGVARGGARLPRGGAGGARHG